MHHAKVLILLTVLCGTGLLAGGGPASASCREAVTVKHARQHLRAAQRDLARAQNRLREARTILSETRTYSSRYSSDVGRWCWLARDTGWPWVTFPQLMLVIDRESGGFPGIVNQSSGASGLMQFLPPWFQGQWGYHSFDPFNPRENLKAGLWLWHREGWNPWSM